MLTREWKCVLKMLFWTRSYICRRIHTTFLKLEQGGLTGAVVLQKQIQYKSSPSRVSDDKSNVRRQDQNNYSDTETWCLACINSKAPAETTCVSPGKPFGDFFEPIWWRCFLQKILQRDETSLITKGGGEAENVMPGCILHKYLSQRIIALQIMGLWSGWEGFNFGGLFLLLQRVLHILVMTNQVTTGMGQTRYIEEMVEEEDDDEDVEIELVELVAPTWNIYHIMSPTMWEKQNPPGSYVTSSTHCFINTMQFVSERNTVCDWEKCSLWVREIQFVSERNTVCDWEKYSLWLREIQFVSERNTVKDWEKYSRWRQSQVQLHFLGSCSLQTVVMR